MQMDVMMCVLFAVCGLRLVWSPVHPGPGNKGPQGLPRAVGAGNAFLYAHPQLVIWSARRGGVCLLLDVHGEWWECMHLRLPPIPTEAVATRRRGTRTKQRWWHRLARDGSPQSIHSPASAGCAAVHTFEPRSPASCAHSNSGAQLPTHIRTQGLSYPRTFEPRAPASYAHSNPRDGKEW